MSTTTLKLNDRDVEVHTQSVFHELGPSSEFDLADDGFFGQQYYYDLMEAKAKKEGKTLFEYLEHQYSPEDVKEYFETEDDLNKYDLFDLLKKFEGLDEIYTNAVDNKVETDSTILPGDLVYSFPTWYPSREYYGIHIVSLDKHGKKILKNYGDGLTFDPITAKLLKELININEKYFDTADSELWSYLSLDGQGTTQDSVKAIISRVTGGRRRKTQRTRKLNQRRRKQTRKHYAKG